MNTDHLVNDTLFSDTLAIGALRDQCPVFPGGPPATQCSR